MKFYKIVAMHDNDSGIVLQDYPPVIAKLFEPNGLLAECSVLALNTEKIDARSSQAVMDICSARGLFFDATQFKDISPQVFAKNLILLLAESYDTSYYLSPLSLESRKSLAEVFLIAYHDMTRSNDPDTGRLLQMITAISTGPIESTLNEKVVHSFLLCMTGDPAVKAIFKEGRASGDIGSYIKTQMGYLSLLWGDTITSPKADAPGNRDFPTAIKSILRAASISKDPVERDSIQTALIRWVQDSIPQMSIKNGRAYLAKLRAIFLKGDYKLQSRFMETIGKSEILLSHQNIDTKTTPKSPFFPKFAGDLFDFILQAGEDKNVRHAFFSEMSRALTENCEGENIQQFLLNVLICAFSGGRDKKGIELALLTWIETAIPRMTSEVGQKYIEILSDIAKDKDLFKGHSKFRLRLERAIAEVPTKPLGSDGWALY